MAALAARAVMAYGGGAYQYQWHRISVISGETYGRMWHQHGSVSTTAGHQ